MRCATPRTGYETVRPPTRATCERGDEGVIAKLAEAAYEGKRSTKWLKLGLGALLIGYHDGVDLVYAGKIGTGFDTGDAAQPPQATGTHRTGCVADHLRAGARAGRALGTSNTRRAGGIQRVDA